MAEDGAAPLAPVLELPTQAARLTIIVEPALVKIISPWSATTEIIVSLGDVHYLRPASGDE